MAKKKEVNYFELMQKEMQYARDISAKLAELIEGVASDYSEETLQEKLDAIHQLEHDGDKMHDEIVFELNRAFITPIEREDILEVTHNIDEITNQIENVAFRLWMFDIKQLRPDMKDFIELINKCCEKTADILADFENFKKSKSLPDLIHQLYDYEHDGDMIYRRAVRNLFTTESNSIEIQKWRELYHDMERCFDACREVARSVQNAVVKNS